MADRFRMHLRLANISFVLLVLAAVAVLMIVSERYRWRWDWTATARNTLSAPSAALLKTLPGRITIKAFVGNDTSARSQLRRLIGRYQHEKRDVRLLFVDPAKHPNETRAAAVQYQGEVQIRYRKREATVTQPTEQSITSTLAGLGRSGLKTWVFATGDGERSPTGNATYDLSAWARQLTIQGMKVATSDLTDKAPLVPGQSVLVLAGPRARLLPGQVDAISHFVADGGDVLWLQDPGPLHGLQPLATHLGLSLLPGEAVDPTSQILTGRADFIAVLRYGRAPVVSGLHMATVFPSARGIQVAPHHTPWQVTPLLRTDPGSWEATRPVPGAVRFHKGQDVAGPLSLGVALERQQKGRAQRIVVIGNESFLANNFLGQAGNLALAMHLGNWLTHNDADINLPTRTAPDSRLTLSPHEEMGIALLFLLLLPLLLFGGGGLLWWRRRRG